MICLDAGSAEGNCKPQLREKLRNWERELNVLFIPSLPTGALQKEDPVCCFFFFLSVPQTLQGMGRLKESLGEANPFHRQAGLGCQRRQLGQEMECKAPGSSLWSLRVLWTFLEEWSD